MRKLSLSVLFVMSAAFLALASESVRATPALPATPVLPKEFAGWKLVGSLQTSTDPAVADGLNAALLKEFGFTDFESATYTREDGRKLTLKAARFGDASGAYGAFVYYKMPQMLAEQIGDQGASLNERVLFYHGNILVDAVFGKLTAMSASELRELAGTLPLPSGGSRKSPSLPDYLPAQSRVNNSIKYVVGPVGLQKTEAPLTASLVDFNAGAEVALGTYNTSGGEATLMLISYPTPQIAADHLRKIDAAHQPNTAQSGGTTILDVGPIFDRRTGPLVVVAAGPLSYSEARTLLASVNYDADVTWNENTYFTKRDNLANLLVNVIILCGIIVGFALVSGIAFGGLRVLIQRVFPDRLFGRPEQVEFISLHLSEETSKTGDSGVS
jgi:hypothetical protein